METKIKTKIEKGIPIPEARFPTSGTSEIFLKMKEGDSIVLPIRFQRNITYNSGRLGMKMKVRRISDTEIRVWRVA